MVYRNGIKEEGRMDRNEKRRIVKNPDVLIQELDGEAVLLNLGNGQYYGLDEVGFRTYELLVSSGSLDAAREELLKEYDSDPAQITSDLDKVFHDLMDHGLIAYG